MLDSEDEEFPQVGIGDSETSAAGEDESGTFHIRVPIQMPRAKTTVTRRHIPKISNNVSWSELDILFTLELVKLTAGFKKHWVKRFETECEKPVIGIAGNDEFHLSEDAGELGVWRNEWIDSIEFDRTVEV